MGDETTCVHCQGAVKLNEAYYWYNRDVHPPHMVALHPLTCWEHFVVEDEPLRECTA